MSTRFCPAKFRRVEANFGRSAASYLNMRFERFLSVSMLAFAMIFAAADIQAQSRRVPTPTPTPTPSADDDPVRVVTEEVKLNVLALDEQGRIAANLSPEDLVISENNILHQPTSVRRLPASVLIVMDTGGEMRQVKGLDQTRRTARAVVRSLRPDDIAAVIQYSDKAEVVSEWSADHDRTLAAIGRTSFGRRSAFAEALNIAAQMLSAGPLENKHLVLITDGTDSSANSSPKFDAIRRLLSGDVTVHVISYTRMELMDIEPRTKASSKTPPPRAMPPEVAEQLPNGVRDVATAPKARTINMDRTLLRTIRARKADLEESERSLSSLAENTNGEFVLPVSADEMIEKAALIARTIHSSYVVTYTPKVPLNDPGGPAERTIIVTSRRPGLFVEARRKLILN
jgi:VWFA-related protein